MASKKCVVCKLPIPPERVKHAAVSGEVAKYHDDVCRKTAKQRRRRAKIAKLTR